MNSVTSVGSASPMFAPPSALDGITSKEALIAKLEDVVILFKKGKLSPEDRLALETLILANFPFTTKSTSLPQLLFFVAVSVKNTSAVSALIEDERVDVNKMNAEGETPLLRACAHCEERETGLVGVLLAAGANVEVTDIKNRTPLMVAAKFGCYNSVLLLLNAHAKIDSVDLDGCNALHLATINRHPNVIRLLLEADGDASVVTSNEEKLSAFHIACKSNNIQVVELMLTFEQNIFGDLSISPAGTEPKALRKGDPLFAQTLAQQIQKINHRPSPVILAQLQVARIQAQAAYANAQKAHAVYRSLQRRKLLSHLSGAGLTGLELAKNRGHLAICRLLLKHAQINS